MLLALATFINYADRGNLATASPMLRGELGLSNAEMGLLFSAFFWSYAPLQPLAGALVQRFGVRRVLAVGLALWATGTAACGFAHGFWQLLACRMLLGIGESVTYPSNAQTLASRLPPTARGRANGLIAVGQALGPTAGTLLGGLLMAAQGWRISFLLFGGLSLLWLLPWMRVTSDETPALRESRAPQVRYRSILGQRALWGTGLGHFAGNYAYYFSLTWLPLFLVKTHGYTVSTMAWVGALVYLMQALGAPLSGLWCDRQLAQGADADRLLKGVMVLALGAVTVLMAGCALANAPIAIALLLLSGFFFGVQSAPLGAITQTLAGPATAARWMGVQNLCGNIAGVIAPIITGIAIDRTGSFSAPFLIASLITLLGIFAYRILIPSVRPIDWESVARRPPRMRSSRP